uniref:DNA-directed RNA polymerase n=1 Tax=Kryptoperidinium triquetrum TaxID=66468 RepID=K7N813_KRYTR|nr:putative T7-like RNA polymerase [Heterocapsa triquetra]
MRTAVPPRGCVRPVCCGAPAPRAPGASSWRRPVGTAATRSASAAGPCTMQLATCGTPPWPRGMPPMPPAESASCRRRWPIGLDSTGVSKQAQTSALEDLSRSDLRMRLTKLEGSQSEFVTLHSTLLQVERDKMEGKNDLGVQAREAILSELEGRPDIRSVPESHPAALQAVIRDYFHDDLPPGRLRDAVTALDTELLGCHRILLEDLSPEMLERWLKEPGLLSFKQEVLSLRRELYGTSRYPIRISAQAQPEPFDVSARRRQLVIERETLTMALRDFLEDQARLIQEGNAAAAHGSRKVWMDWVRALVEQIEALRDDDADNEVKARVLQGKGAKAAKLMRDLPLDAQLLAVITCHTVLNQMLVPHYRNENEPGMAPFVSLVVAVGDAVENECIYRSQELPTQAKREIRVLINQLQRRNSLGRLWDKASQTVPIGAALVDMLLEVGQVQDGLAPDGSGMAKAFTHELVWEGKHKLCGYVKLTDRARQALVIGTDAEGLMRYLVPKHQPMVVPPVPWRPSGESPQGCYLMRSVPFIRTPMQSLAQLRAYSPTTVARVMDSVGSTPWRVNKDILRLMEEVSQRDLAVAGVPPHHNPEVPVLPKDQGSLSEQALKDLKLRRDNAMKQCQQLASDRPTFFLKLRSAQDFEHAERIYFPHNVDFRGRAYPVPPHLNHIGDDVCRGLLQFADPKPLGKDGLYWLKVTICGLLGKNKITFDARVEYIDGLKELIIAVAEDPLAEEHLKFWAEADDGPWQTLARCQELAAAWKSGDPESFMSAQPIHLDGTCNGLQHYAALGRDEAGGHAVNLTPSDRPQDVYTIVLGVVTEKVEREANPVAVKGGKPKGNAADAEAEEAVDAKLEETRQLAVQAIELGVLQRKVVKQTVMTICYGVTKIGAIAQIQGQLEDMCGDKVSSKDLKPLARYLTKHVLSSIDEVFEQAMEIKRWFDKVSKIMNGLEVPTSWVSPIGLACAQPYKKSKSVQVLTKLQKVSIKEADGTFVNKAKQRMGFPPNFIHSLDASHMMMTADGCRRDGILFAGVHDSFWTHACDAPTLNRLIREAFVELHGRPVLEELRRDLCVHVGAAGEDPPELPKQGSLDLSLVHQSKYIFG